MKVLVGLSGGVDSAVSAYLLKEQGHEVIGAMMTIWNPDLPVPKTSSANACLGPEKEDIELCEKVANHLKIPFYVIDCRDEYERIVLENFRNEYRVGRTPNPCVWCNSFVKFKVLPNSAKAAGIDFAKFATGHYAKIVFNELLGRHQLCRALDKTKDQTYFLYRLSADTLSNTIFPLGDLTKKEVREIAKKAAIPVFDKPDSQDFYCGDYNDILRFEEKPGDIIDSSGKVLGRHKGIWNYTIGQRRGLNISSAQALYVIKLDAQKNQVIVGSKEELFCAKLSVINLSWGSICEPAGEIRVLAKIRQQHPLATALFKLGGGGIGTLEFDQPQMAVTAGQSVVFYDGEIVLGGGIIA